MRFVVALTPEQYRRYLERCFKLFIIGAALFFFLVVFVKGTNYIKRLIYPEKVVSESVSNKKIIDNLTKQIEVHPINVDLYKQRGDLYLKEKSYDNAIKDFNKQIELQGQGSLSTYNNYKKIINIYVAQKRYQEAFATYDRLFKYHYWGGDDYNNRGCLHMLLGKKQSALLDFETAKQKFIPDDFSINFNLAQAYEILGNKEKALKAYTDASASNAPLTKEIEDKLRARFKGDWSSSKQWLESRKIDPNGRYEDVFEAI